MTNKQWIIWKMIDMHSYELGEVLSGGCYIWYRPVLCN